MAIVLPEPFEDLIFMTPLSEARARRLVRFVAGDLDGTILDVGCGWAELLLRVLEHAPRARGIGVDSDPASIRHATLLAHERGLADRITLMVGDARTTGPEHTDAVICIGASQIWGPPVEANKPLDYSAALTAIRAKVPRHARVLYGEGIWSRPSTPEAVAPLSGRLDELVSLSELLEIAVDHGFMPVAVHEAGIDEWDEFESGYSAGYATWLAEHEPDHEDAAEVRVRAARQRAGYYAGYRGIMGMAYLCLVAV